MKITTHIYRIEFQYDDPGTDVDPYLADEAVRLLLEGLPPECLVTMRTLVSISGGEERLLKTEEYRGVKG